MPKYGRFFEEGAMEQKRNTHIRKSRYSPKVHQEKRRQHQSLPVREAIITSRMRENIRIRQQYIILQPPDSEAAAEKDVSV